MTAKDAHHFQDDLLNLIKSRRSIRKYRKAKPDLPKIDRIIDCAIYAPSAHNAQPWRFYIVEDKTKKGDLIECMAARFKQDLEKDHVPMAVIRKKIERSIRLFSNAPLIIIACIDKKKLDKYSDVTRQQAELLMATQSLAASIQNLLLATRALGLSGCWYCAPLFCPDVVKTSLSLPDDHLPQALITLGYPGENPPPPRRDKLDEIRFIL